MTEYKQKDSGAVLNDFVDLSMVDSYPGNIVIMDHIRGTGKSYAVFNRAIKRFVERGEGFVVIRRTKGEIDSLRDYPWPDGLAEYWKNKGVTLSNQGRKLFINKKFTGKLMYLSGNGIKNAKSTALPFPVTTALFDEFQIESDFGGRYLKNEVQGLTSIIKSYVRYNDFKLFLCGNSDSYYNPYYIEWDVWPKLDGGIRFYKKFGGVVIWHAVRTEFNDKKLALSDLEDNALSGTYKDMSTSMIWKSNIDDEAIARVEIEPNRILGLFKTQTGAYVWKPKGDGVLWSLSPHDKVASVTVAPWFEDLQRAIQLGMRYYDNVELKRYFENNKIYL